MKPRTRVEELLVKGATELGNGDWAEARKTYHEAVELGQSGPTLEGFAGACWWLRDADAAIDARRRAFRLYLDGDDRPSAARVAISLVWDHIFRGERSIAGGWVGRAEKLLEDLGTVEGSAWLAVVKSHIALMVDRDPSKPLGSPARALRLGARSEA